MSLSRTLRRTLVVALAGGAVACGLGSSGLLDAVDTGTSSPPGTTSSSGSSSGSPGDGTLDAAASGSSSGSSGSSGGIGSSSGSTGGGSSSGTAPPSGDDSSTPTGDDDDTSGDDASILDAGLPDVHVLDPDAAAADAATVCDLDEDGFLAMGACGGTDCCDYDSRAHPGETDYFTGEDACGTFDYNCNGSSELQFGVSNCTLSGFSCGSDGFDSDAAPPCGASATYNTCKYQLVTCSSDQSTKVQACR